MSLSFKNKPYFRLDHNQEYMLVLYYRLLRRLEPHYVYLLEDTMV